MFYRIAADAVVSFHLLFILFVLFGGLLVLRWRWLTWLHLPAATWGVLVEVLHLECPLTRWENLFRQAAGQGGYGGGFIEHYLIPLIYLTVYLRIYRTRRPQAAFQSPCGETARRPPSD